MFSFYMFRVKFHCLIACIFCNFIISFSFNARWSSLTRFAKCERFIQLENDTLALIKPSAFTSQSSLAFFFRFAYYKWCWCPFHTQTDCFFSSSKMHVRLSFVHTRLGWSKVTEFPPFTAIRKCAFSQIRCVLFMCLCHGNKRVEWTHNNPA